MPAGYKYNCSLQANISNNSNISCIKELDNQTFITQLGYYIYNTTNYYGFSFGWDMKDSNFTNPTYLNSIFIKYWKAVIKAADQPIEIELVDKGNLYS